MEYNDLEKQTLDMLQRTDFKNLSKNEIVGFVSKLSEMRPEVAKDIIAQFPELTNFMKSTLVEYKEMLEGVIKSDDTSIENYYDINKKALAGASDSRNYYKEFAERVLDDCNKLLDRPNLSIEDALKIIKQETEILDMISKLDQQVFEQEKYYEDKADKKDSEKRQFNWKLVGVASTIVVGIASVTVAALTGGDVKFKLPNKS